MSQPVQFVRALAPEEQARANFYGLLARLFYAPADADLLRTLAAAGDMAAEDRRLADAWRELGRAAAGADPEAVRDEFDSAFVSTGKAPVTLYAGAYSARHTNEMPLATLRRELAALGLVRREGATEPEDHIAALFDTMRHLVSDAARELDEQKRFFERWIIPVVEPLCAAIEKSEHTSFYKRVARLAKAFVDVEHAAFEML